MDTEVLREGVLKKKKSRVNTWADRYFKLKHNCLEYYVKANETVPDISFCVFYSYGGKLLGAERCFPFNS